MGHFLKGFFDHLAVVLQFAVGSAYVAGYPRKIRNDAPTMARRGSGCAMEGATAEVLKRLVPQAANSASERENGPRRDKGCEDKTS
jgi:hypothetical protein